MSTNHWLGLLKKSFSTRTTDPNNCVLFPYMTDSQQWALKR